MKINLIKLIHILLLSQLQLIYGFPQQGKWILQLNDSSIGQYNGVAKNLYKGTKIFIRVNCHPTGESNEISIGWILRETQVMILSLQSYSEDCIECHFFLHLRIFVPYRPINLR